MVDPIQLHVPPRVVVRDKPAGAMDIGLSLLSRRSAAVADFWRSCAEIRQPTELMAAQLGYWSQLVDDYQAAFSDGLHRLAQRQEVRAADGTALSA